MINLLGKVIVDKTEWDKKDALISHLQEQYEKLHKEEGLTHNGDPVGSVLQAREVARILADDPAYVECDTHPLMLLIQRRVRGRFDELLLDHMNLPPRQEETEADDQIRAMESRNIGNRHIALYGKRSVHWCGESMPLYPPEQDRNADRSRGFCRFPAEEYEHSLTSEPVEASSFTGTRIKLSTIGIEAEPWNFGRLRDAIAKTSEASYEWRPDVHTESFVFELPFCLLCKTGGGNHALTAGLLSDEAEIDLAQPPIPTKIRNYTNCALFDKIQTDGGKWYYDGEPYAYVCDAQNAAIWEMARAVHDADLPIKYRGYTVNEIR